MGVTVQFLRLSKNRDEHGRNILQEVFRVRMLENRGVLLQLVSHLINDEAAVIGQSVMRLAQKRAFLIDIQDAEGNSGNNVIALRNTPALAIRPAKRRRPD